MAKENVYLDYAAATPIDLDVQSAMAPYFCNQFQNPSSFHMPGKQVKDALDKARGGIATLLGARPDEIIFTSGGTEADNLAILGFARKNAEHGKHIIVSSVEHKAVLEPALQLKKEGFDVTVLETDESGQISVEKLQSALRDDTILVSLIYGNNEIGTLNPIQKIGSVIRKHREARKSLFPIFHTDACQAVGSEEINVQKINVDMMTLNGGKIYGPKGVGMLYMRRGIKLEPLMFGGDQEARRRPGTENVPAIIGFAKALEIAVAQQAEYTEKTIKLRDELIAGIRSAVPHVRLNGHATERLPNNASFSFMDVEGEALLLYLDAQGVFASTGSACTSASLDPSHVIMALGVPAEVAHSSLRFTLGRETSKEEIAYVLEVLPGVVEKLRGMSPKSGTETFYE
ncbi:MAG: aminotransferase class V-fold PLP-dependent enzyme [Patescibacteria group bacterium]